MEHISLNVVNLFGKLISFHVAQSSLSTHLGGESLDSLLLNFDGIHHSLLRLRHRVVELLDFATPCIIALGLELDPV